MENDWSIDIAGDKRWEVRPNPFGSGLMLVVYRGVWSAEHADLFSFYTDGTPDEEETRHAIEEMKEDLVGKITDYISLQNRGTSEAMACIFCKHLIRDIAERAYKIACSR